MAYARVQQSEESAFYICKPAPPPGPAEGLPQSVLEVPGADAWIPYWEATRASHGNLTEHELPIVTSGQVRVEVEGFGASQKKCPIYIRIPCLRNGSVIKAVRRTCAPAIVRLN